MATEPPFSLLAAKTELEAAGRPIPEPNPFAWDEGDLRAYLADVSAAYDPDKTYTVDDLRADVVRCLDEGLDPDGTVPWKAELAALRAGEPSPMTHDPFAVAGPQAVAGRPWVVCRLLGDEVYEFDAAAVELTPELAARLLGFRPLLDPLRTFSDRFYAAEFFDDGCEFGQLNSPDLGEPDFGEWVTGESGDTFEAGRVSASMLRVMPDGV